MGVRVQHVQRPPVKGVVGGKRSHKHRHRRKPSLSAERSASQLMICSPRTPLRRLPPHRQGRARKLPPKQSQGAGRVRRRRGSAASMFTTERRRGRRGGGCFANPSSPPRANSSPAQNGCGALSPTRPSLLPWSVGAAAAARVQLDCGGGRRAQSPAPFLQPRR